MAAQLVKAPLVQTRCTTTTICLSWESFAGPNATYFLLMSPSGEENSFEAVCSTKKSSSYAVTHLIPNTCYWFTIVAIPVGSREPTPQPMPIQCRTLSDNESCPSDVAQFDQLYQIGDHERTKFESLVSGGKKQIRTEVHKPTDECVRTYLDTKFRYVLLQLDDSTYSINISKIGNPSATFSDAVDSIFEAAATKEPIGCVLVVTYRTTQNAKRVKNVFISYIQDDLPTRKKFAASTAFSTFISQISLNDKKIIDRKIEAQVPSDLTAQHVLEVASKNDRDEVDSSKSICSDPF